MLALPDTDALGLLWQPYDSNQVLTYHYMYLLYRTSHIMHVFYYPLPKILTNLHAVIQVKNKCRKK